MFSLISGQLSWNFGIRAGLSFCFCTSVVSLSADFEKGGACLIMSDVWSRAWCETQKVPNFAVKGKEFILPAFAKPNIMQ